MPEGQRARPATPADEDAARATPSVASEGLPSTRWGWDAPPDPTGSFPSPDVEAVDEPFPTVPGYEVLGVLGRGGMGVVYRARQVHADRVVALKMIRPGAASPAARARFLAEARAAAGLRHPNIASVYDVGEHAGRPYFSLELADGGSLARRLNGSPLAPREAAGLVEQLARAIDHAHRAGVVHRDLKPGNVLLAGPVGPMGPIGPMGLIPKVADFGLAKHLKEAGQTQTGAVVGTPAYMAPEQAAGQKDVGPAADVYGLGAILYECLTGRPPFQADSTLAVYDQVRSRDPDPPRKVNPGVPRDLQTVALKCLEKEPGKRYESAAELADDLGRFLRDEPIRARPVSVWGRGRKWVRRHPTRAAGLAGILLVLLAAAAGGLWYWDTHHRLKVAYFANHTKRWGAMEGVGPLTAEEARHRGVSYRVLSRGGRVERVEVVNGSGHPAINSGTGLLIDDAFDPALAPSRVFAFEYRRDANGRVTEEVGYDRAGELVFRFLYTSETTAQFTDARGFPLARVGSGAAYVELHRSPDGFDLQEVYYVDRDGRRRPGADRTFGYRADMDPRGLPVRVTFLDAAGRPMRNRHGFAAISFDRDARGDAVSSAYHDVDGKPVTLPQGYARVALAHDARGNRTDLTFQDADGRPTPHRDGYATVHSEYDDRGNAVLQSYLGPAGRPTRHRDGYAAVRMEYDDRGQLTRGTYLGPDGGPAVTRTGEHGWAARYDDRGQMVDATFFGADGQPTLVRGGYSRFTGAYDARGNRTELAYFGPAGEATATADGYHRFTARFDEANREVEIAYFDPHGSPATDRSGLARWTRQYDRLGNETERAYYDPAGRPTAGTLGYHRQTGRYDDHGNKVEWAFFGPAGEPAVVDGLHRGTAAYDPRGNQVELAYFGPDGRPARHKGGYHKAAFRFDDRNNRLEVRYLDEAGKPVLSAEGLARWAATYDERGFQLSEASFGIDDKPVRQARGYHEWRARYDGAGNRTEIEYRGPAGELTTGPEGAARMVRRFDGRGNLLERALFAADGGPAVHPDGHHRYLSEFDARGNETGWTLFGPDGGPARHVDGYHRGAAEYDAAGNRVAMAFFDADGRPAVVRQGYHRWAARYDPRGNELQTTYFGPDGKPARFSGEYDRRAYEYDAAGRRVGATFRDEAEGAGWHTRTQVLDAAGRVTREAYLDRSGRPVIHRARGYAAVTTTYDDRGDVVSRQYTDADGRPVRVRAVLATVTAGGPGAQLGLQPGDVLVGYAGRPVTDTAGYLRDRKGESAGSGPRGLVVWRAGRALSVPVRPGLLGVTLEDRVVEAPELGPMPRAVP